MPVYVLFQVPAEYHSIAVDDKDRLASPSAVLADPPGRFALPVDVLDKVEILALEDIFGGAQLLRSPAVQDSVDGHGKEQADAG